MAGGAGRGEGGQQVPEKPKVLRREIFVGSQTDQKPRERTDGHATLLLHGVRRDSDRGT